MRQQGKSLHFNRCGVHERAPRQQADPSCAGLMGSAGWVLVAFGPILTAGVYGFVVRRNHSGSSRIALGAAALVGLLWFLSTADWLSPPWKAFWDDHGITAGVISSALAVAAGWTFVDVRQQHRRTASLYANWGNWLRGQAASVAELIKLIEAGPDGESAAGHCAHAAGARATLMVQQQWAASTYTVLLLRATTEEERGLMNGLTAIRRHGSFALRELAMLETLLMNLGMAPLSREESRDLWEKSLVALMNLRNDLVTHEQFVKMSRFAADQSAGGSA